ncbi:MAG: hypothetical protein WC615_18555 [Mucilaginibacter sp.]|jgi:hypothetical protein|uniref:hypothetical protein n=1 Tax=Mucilaginibacter sp. TaxID=1882438 RepID=UPI00356590AF
MTPKLNALLLYIFIAILLTTGIGLFGYLFYHILACCTSSIMVLIVTLLIIFALIIFALCLRNDIRNKYKNHTRF